jgi:hypothetical protein
VINMDGYKQKVSDEQLINLVESGVQNSIGDWLNSSDLARERLKSTYEYAGVAESHLKPQGVSSIVDTSTTEVIEAYTAILSELFLNNGKLAKFEPMDDSPAGWNKAHQASMLTNHAIFKQNKGWELLQTWIKSALLWKNSIIRWDYIEDYQYKIEEYDEITPERLDLLLSEDGVELIGELKYDNKISTVVDPLADPIDAQLIYTDVRIRRKKDKSRVRIENIPPEAFRISRDAKSIDEAVFVGIQVEMTRSEIRKQWPDIVKGWSEDDWNELGTDDGWMGSTRYSQDIAARKFVTGQEYWQGSASEDHFPLEANRPVTITECWMYVDRDGDGIAELKHFIIVGSNILDESDVDMVPLACLSPIDIPFEFYGLSMADFTRSSTLASTAILRGFVENTYLTNYAPKLADPNVVDFSALQNMKPKQIIPTNGNPQAAVSPLPPEAISTGTVPLLEHLQLLKEQATGMSKAAQGLQDELYVSGNSEAKLSAIQSASQKRIQHIARRFAETGLKRLCKGVYQTMRECVNTKIKMRYEGVYLEVDPQELPHEMECTIFLDLGENSNANQIQKLTKVGSEILPALNEQGAGMVVKPQAPAILATKLVEAMGLDSNDFLEDYTTNEFKEKAAKSVEEQTKSSMERQQMETAKLKSDAALAEANVSFTNAQSKNTMDDNAKQLAVAIDRHFQEWADLEIKAAKEGMEKPVRPDFHQIIQMAKTIINPPDKGQ